MATRLRRITFTGPLSVALLAILVMSPALGQTNTKPIADITATPSSGDVGSFIFFDATASRDADQMLLRGGVKKLSATTAGP